MGFFTKTQRRRRPGSTVRLAVEGLEERVNLNTNYWWQGGVSVAWSNGANWATDYIDGVVHPASGPNSTDDIVNFITGATEPISNCELNMTATVGGLSFWNESGAQALNPNYHAFSGYLRLGNGGTGYGLTVTGNGTDTTGRAQLNAGTLYMNSASSYGTLTISGTDTQSTFGATSLDGLSIIRDGNQTDTGTIYLGRAGSTSGVLTVNTITSCDAHVVVNSTLVMAGASAQLDIFTSSANNSEGDVLVNSTGELDFKQTASVTAVKHGHSINLLTNHGKIKQFNNVQITLAPAILNGDGTETGDEVDIIKGTLYSGQVPLSAGYSYKQQSGTTKLWQGTTLDAFDYGYQQTGGSLRAGNYDTAANPTYAKVDSGDHNVTMSSSQIYCGDGSGTDAVGFIFSVSTLGSTLTLSNTTSLYCQTYIKSASGATVAQFQVTGNLTVNSANLHALTTIASGVTPSGSGTPSVTFVTVSIAQSITWANTNIGSFQDSSGFWWHWQLPTSSGLAGGVYIGQ